MRTPIIVIVLGVITLVIGLMLAGVLDSSTADSGDPRIRCKTASGTSYSGILISKTAAQCSDSAGTALAAADFAVPTPTAGQLSALNANDAVPTTPDVANFAGAAAINNLTPLIYRVVIVIAALSMIGLGARNIAVGNY